VSFYLGEEALLKGEEKNAAALFDETRTNCPKELNEHRGAIAELQRLARPALTERSESTSETSVESTR
jgi:lipoprotein NlpI